MPIFEKNGERILFIHVPKCGGSTVEEAFIQSGYSFSYLRGLKFGSLIPFDRRNGCTPQHLHAELLDKHLLGQQFDFEFTILRDPIDRFVSEYRFRRETGHSLAKEGLSSFASKAFEWFRTNPSILDNHIRPQSDFPRKQTLIFNFEDGLPNILEKVRSSVADLSFDTDLHERRGSFPIDKSELEQISDKIRNFYRDDYTFLSLR